MATQSNSKRLAKNTAFMYIRMLLLMAISLYTSRIILQQLGVDDYGIYNLVGSIVMMFTSLKAIFASSTQRFLNYEMGRNNPERLQLIYSTSTIVNFLIAIVFAVIVEVVGLWFLEFKANISPDRLVAAHWVFQFSVISTVISITSTPLDASVIAHERMDFYAYLSIFEGVAKLVICYVLAFAPFDKLIFYGLLILLVAVIVRVINQVFCAKNFSECHFKYVWDKACIKDMTAFAGWSFFGNTAYILSQSGINLVLNVFGGPVVNAARGIAYQVSSALRQFVINLSVVVKPYGIKTYSSGDIKKALELSYMSSKVFFFVQLLICICFTFFTEDIIRFWLGQVPDYTVVFLNLVLLQALFQSFLSPIDMLFAAEGDIKVYQLVEGILLAMPVPVSYILLSFGLSFYSVFVCIVLFEFLNVIAIAYIASKKCNLIFVEYIRSVFIPCLLCVVVYGVLFYFVNSYEGLIIRLGYASIALVIELSLMYFVVLGATERRLIKDFVKNKLKK